MDKCLLTSNSDEWYTPINFFKELDHEFNFTLDPCGCYESHLCKKYFDKFIDGMAQSWKDEIVFCNPPYSQVKQWVFKCWFENFYHNALVVLLIPARTDTKYFHQYIYNQPNVEIRFIKGRLKFSNSKNSAPFPSMLVIFKR